LPKKQRFDFKEHTPDFETSSKLEPFRQLWNFKKLPQRIEKPNGLEQLGFSIRWKKIALFVKILAVKNLSETRTRIVILEESFCNSRQFY
jgi:hypothetical protein